MVVFSVGRVSVAWVLPPLALQTFLMELSVLDNSSLLLCDIYLHVEPALREGQL